MKFHFRLHGKGAARMFKGPAGTGSPGGDKKVFALFRIPSVDFPDQTGLLSAAGEIIPKQEIASGRQFDGAAQRPS